MAGAAFELDEILDESRRAAGLDDFGGPDFRPGLEALAATYGGGRFNGRGRARARRRLVQLLTTRLRMQAAWSAHPEILERPIRRPMVLTGLPRSATSALFGLLGCDPAARPLRLWETQFPDPIPLQPGQLDPRREAPASRYATAPVDADELRKIHATGPDTPEECVLLHSYAFHGVQLGIEVLLEPYASWFRTQDLRGMYAYTRQILQLLDWQRPGRRWLLKTPAHLWGIAPLIECFPDVSLVWCHRDPVSSIASVCSLTWTMMRPITDLTRPEIGPLCLDFYATSLERGLAMRELQDPSRFIDVDHDAFVADPLVVVKRIYERFDLPIAPSAQAAFEAHVAANPRGRHGRHAYALEEYGLDADSVRARFAAIVDRTRIHG